MVFEKCENNKRLRNSNNCDALVLHFLSEAINALLDFSLKKDKSYTT